MTLRTLFNRSASGAVLVAAICASSATLADTKTEKEKAGVPFKAAFVISELIVGADGSCQRITTISGSGTASHLGRATLTSQDCVNIAGFSPVTFNFVSNNVKLQAANGDQLFATYSGTAVLQPAGGALLLSGNFTLAGGTGRFAGATGGGSLEGLEDISTAPAHGMVMLSGRISY